MHSFSTPPVRHFVARVTKPRGWVACQLERAPSQVTLGQPCTVAGLLLGPPELPEPVRLQWRCNGAPLEAEQNLSSPWQATRHPGHPHADTARFRLKGLCFEEGDVVEGVWRGADGQDVTVIRLTAAPQGSDGSSQDVSESAELPWVLLRYFHSATARPKEGRPYQLGGVLVVSNDAPPDLTLHVQIRGAIVDATWSLPSRRIAARFPGVRRASAARFRMAVDALPLSRPDPKLLLRWSGNERLLHCHMGESSDSKLDELLESAQSWAAPGRSIAEAAEQLERLSDLEQNFGSDIRWMQAAVLIWAASRTKGRRAFEALEALRVRWGEDGREEFSAFNAEVAALVHPRTLTHYGYLAPVSSKLTTAKLDYLESFLGAVSRLGRACFANSGTLLGMVREGRPLAHDFDVDLAIVLNAREPGQAALEMAELAEQLGASGHPVSWGADRWMRIWKLDKADFVDVFPAWFDEQDRLYVWPHTCGELARDDLLPLHPGVLGQLEIGMPKRAEAMLQVNYGPHWRQPDPTWRFDWELAALRFQQRFPGHTR